MVTASLSWQKVDNKKGREPFFIDWQKISRALKGRELRLCLPT